MAIPIRSPSQTHQNNKMTKNASPHSLTYLKFLNLVQAIRAIPAFPALDALEERLLNVFAAAWHSGRQITVLEAMGMLSDISPTTAHRRLKTLRKKGMIELKVDEIDSRVKYITPSEVAVRYFGAMGECLDKAQRAA